MDAWILHIKEEFFDERGTLHFTNDYSAWASHRLAQKEVVKFLQPQVDIDRWWRGKLADDQILCEAVRALLGAGKIEESISLINKYSAPAPHKTSFNFSHKLTISIVKSKFFGSAFE